MKYMRLVAIIVIAIVLAVLCASWGRKSGDTFSSTKVTAKLTSIREIGMLEVMTASIRVNRYIGIAERNEDKPDYAALYDIPGTVVYSVDLSKLDIDVVNTEVGRRKVLVGIPTPEVSLMVAENEINKLDEWQKGLFTGTAESGYKKYMQASKDSVDAVEKEISDSENLKSRAMESAKTQIDMLIRNLSIDDCDTVLYFL